MTAGVSDQLKAPGRRGKGKKTIVQPARKPIHNALLVQRRFPLQCPVKGKIAFNRLCSGRVVKIAQYPPGRGDVLGKHRHGRLFFQAKNVNRALLRRPPSLPVARPAVCKMGIQPRQFPISLWEIQIDPRLHQ